MSADVNMLILEAINFLDATKIEQSEYEIEPECSANMNILTEQEGVVSILKKSKSMTRVMKSTKEILSFPEVQSMKQVNDLSYRD